MASAVLGKVSPTPKGEYVSTQDYARLDVVTYEGYPYLAKSNVPSGNLPTDELYWMPLLTDLDFAPSGYGLGLTGSHMTAISDANEAQRNGWYLIDKDTTNGIGTNAIMRVESEAWAHCVQTAYGASHSSSRPLIKQRVKCNGTWSGWVDCDPAAFAPSGYGLGLSDSTPLCSNANDAWQNGWFKIDSSTQNGIGVSAIMRVDARASAYSVCQTAYSTSWSSAYPVVRQRWCMNGTWDTEWSWVDPPMTLGVEYRTTERWNGKPVYAKLVDLGASENGKVIQVLNSGMKMIRHEDRCTSYPLPHINQILDSAWTYYLMPDQEGFALKMFCGSSVTGKQTYSTVYYYKE